MGGLCYPRLEGSLLVPKGVESDQLANSGTANKISNTISANAAKVYDGIETTLQAESSHPSVYSPTQLATMNTAAQQSAGGSQSATTGQGGLYAARTRNA